MYRKAQCPRCVARLPGCNRWEAFGYGLGQVAGDTSPVAAAKPRVLGNDASFLRGIGLDLAKSTVRQRLLVSPCVDVGLGVG